VPYKDTGRRQRGLGSRRGSLAAADAGPIVLVAAVKANFFNAPRLPLMTFADGYLLLVLFRTIGSRVFRGH
jgi:hypothetical protein